MTVETETRMTAPERKNAILLEEIEHLLHCDVGEAAILHALGYVGTPAALKRRLHRLKRYDLIPRIFEADTLYHMQHSDMGIGTATARKARV
ncbi:hypothetical protein SEA_HIRKO_44 [Arthrobacter phage Hirko]|nr:hypothetical protein SEA_HIRKO_44 [Arthrobacter phage Hirko]